MNYTSDHRAAGAFAREGMTRMGDKASHIWVRDRGSACAASFGYAVLAIRGARWLESSVRLQLLRRACWWTHTTRHPAQYEQEVEWSNHRLASFMHFLDFPPRIAWEMNEHRPQRAGMA